MATLPQHVRRRFSFNKGLAEHLDIYPLYDVIVNFCLEHVRNPQHVVEEALRHLKPRGRAYFTPPYKHGADSPAHLHHFEEGDLLKLVPEGYRANVFLVKLQESSPKLNCFVFEVFKGA